MHAQQDTFFLVGHHRHTGKHKALGPYVDSGIVDQARGRQTITAYLTEDGRYPDTGVSLYRVDNATDPTHAWRKVASRLKIPA